MAGVRNVADFEQGDAKSERVAETFVTCLAVSTARSNRYFPVQMLDERTTEQLDLRGGRTPWLAGFQRLRRQSTER